MFDINGAKESADSEVIYVPIQIKHEYASVANQLLINLE